MEVPESTQSLVAKAQDGNSRALDEIASRSAKRLEPWIDRRLGSKLRRCVTAAGRAADPEGHRNASTNP